MSETLSILVFYLIFSSFSIIGLTLLLRTTKSRSVFLILIAKPLGLVVFGYFIWFLASFKIINFRNQKVLYSLFALFLIISAFFIFKYVRKIKFNKKKIYKFLLKLITLEIFSILLFVGFIYLRSFKSDIEGTERFMDMHLYTSAGKTDYFPFIDGWLPPENVSDKPVDNSIFSKVDYPDNSVNYYYYGFYLFALLTRLSGVEYSIGYNLSFVYIFVFCVMISFAIVYRLTKSYLFSALGAGFVSLAGNLHYTKCAIDNFKPSGTLDSIKNSNIINNISQGCFYPKATRILDPAKTINEMPSYSFLLGDMHPHVMGVPFLLMNLYLIVLFHKNKSLNIVLLFCLMIGLASSALINTWDAMALCFVFFLSAVYKFFKSKSKIKSEFIKKIKENRDLFIYSFALAASIVILMLPFLRHFKSPVMGIGLISSYLSAPHNVALNEDFQAPSSFGFLFGLWGIYFAFSLLALVILILRNLKLSKLFLPAAFFLTGVLLIVASELFYFKDLFHITHPGYFRANTVFKLGYISWIVSSIAFALFLSLLWKESAKIKSFALGILADNIFAFSLIAFMLAVFIYPIIGIKQVYSPSLPWHIKANERKINFSIDGNNYLKTRNPEDYGVIQWLNKNEKERIVLVESIGSSYTYHARIAINTGMMNPTNWPTHEWTWRFHYPNKDDKWQNLLGKRDIDTGYGLVGYRVEDVKRIYESTDKSFTKSLLEKYNVKYVYIGDQERTTYPMLQEKKFRDLGKVVYENGNSRLYLVK